MIKVAVNGACGRMGSSVVANVLNDGELQLVAALEHEGHQLLGQDVGTAQGQGESGVKVSRGFNGKADVLIDFSEPACSVEKAVNFASAGTALVICTTGHTPEQTAKIKETARQVPCLISPNMSLGVNLIFQLAARVAKTLGDDYDIEIVEVHHRFKKDSPSGTAIKIADEICKSTGKKLDDVAVYGREGQVGERSRGEIGIHAIRAGDTVGDHKVVFGNLGETIELVHSAHSRDTFAMGAIKAAKYVVNKPPGLYDMKDVIHV
ncbi:MAG: 4-hydroxy-tetrahydrodipicolinate reductase [Candidatus Brocadiales bacterium]|nr:4-hydroxy-tetrahydrodipicolinate reductase [Candidatus Bathyanammoxibius sp.]MCQ4573911.1 4-hydroxy-tetrahydrodipicolinate reductase [Candidatus Bathyanammoxibius amoris]